MIRLKELLYQKTILKIALGIWLVLWVNFLLRDLIKGGRLKEYSALLGSDEKGRISYMFGPELSEFLDFCKRNCPEGATYSLVGVDEYSLEWRRSLYYLFPLVPDKSPEYYLVFGQKDFTPEGYVKYAICGNKGLIFKAQEE